MDGAYPGLGIGAVVPSDRCGFGCTTNEQTSVEPGAVGWLRWQRRGRSLRELKGRGGSNYDVLL